MGSPTALVGYTGFVGSNLESQLHFDEKFNSRNSQEMSGRSFSTVYFSAAPAEKWKANSNPDADSGVVNDLIRLLGSFKAERLVLLSTIDVYEKPTGVDEGYEPKDELLHTYGRNRLKLEKAVENLFDNSTILRLPALFGVGLKKNAIFDLIHNNEIDKIKPNAQFQFYNMENLATDCEKAMHHSIPLLNICSRPIRIGQVAEDIFGISLPDESIENPATYDVRSLYSSFWAGDEYLYSVESVLGDLEKFVRNEFRKLSEN